jgi:hypothetical protein
MNDALFLIKEICLVISVLLIFEISMYLLANRNDRLKNVKRSTKLVTSMTGISLGFAFFLFFTAVGTLFFMLELYQQYFDSSNYALIIIRMKNLWFLFGIWAIITYILLPITNLKNRVLLWTLSTLIFLTLVLPNGIFDALVGLLSCGMILPVLFFYQLAQWAPKQHKTQFWGVIIGIICISFAGIWLLSPMAPFLDLKSIPFGEILLLSGCMVLIISIISIRSLNEAIFSLFIEDLYITTADGSIIYQTQFKPVNQPKMEDSTLQEDNQFLATSLVGIDGILREISASEGLLKTLVHKDKILVIEKTESLTGIIVSTIELEGFRVLLQKMLELDIGNLQGSEPQSQKITQEVEKCKIPVLSRFGKIYSRFLLNQARNLYN